MKASRNMVLAILVAVFLVLNTGLAVNANVAFIPRFFEQGEQRAVADIVYNDLAETAWNNAGTEYAVAQRVVPLALPPGTAGESEANPATTQQEFVAAIAAAKDGDTIYVACIALDSTVEIAKDLTIIGVNNAEISLSAEVDAGSFHITSPGNVLTLNNLIFIGTDSAGGLWMGDWGNECTLTMENCGIMKCMMLNIYGSVKLTNCVFSDNSEFSFCIMSEDKLSNVEITGCTFSDNDVFSLDINCPKASMKDCTVRENESFWAKFQVFQKINISDCAFRSNEMFALFISGSDSEVEMERCTFSENNILEYRSGVSVSNIQKASIINCTFTNSGDISIQTPGSMQLTNCTFSGEVASSLHLTGGNIALTDCVISASSAQVIQIVGAQVELVRCKIDENIGATHISISCSEKGIATDCTFNNNVVKEIITFTNLDMNNCTFIGNTAYILLMNAAESNMTHFTIADNVLTYGILMSGGTVNMTDCIVSGNVVPMSENARSILDVNCEFFNMTNCTVSGNTTEGDGGGILFASQYNMKNEMTLINCTISGNASKGDGGGLYVNASDTYHINVKLMNCTITGNTTEGNGGGIHAGGNIELAIYGSIIAGNTASGSGDNIFDDETGAWADVGVTTDGHYNIIGYANGVTEQSVFGGAPVVKDNGGAKPTILINPEGPACNAIPENVAWDLPLTDQRGVARPQEDYADIGAVEIKREHTPEQPGGLEGREEPVATGDNNRPLLWLVAGTLSAGLGIALWVWKKARRRFLPQT